MNGLRSSPWRSFRGCAALLLAVATLAACDAEPPAHTQQDDAAPPGEVQAAAAVAEVPPDEAPVAGNARSLPRLKIIVPANLAGGRYLPRRGSPVGEQQALVESFAQAVGMQPELVVMNRFSEMIPALQRGEADILAANLTVTPERRQLIDFSIPLTHVREQILVAADQPELTAESDLAGKKIMVDRASSFWSSLEKLRKRVPDLILVERPAGLLDEEELDLVAQGAVDATVRDSNVADMYLGYRDDIRIAFDLPGRKAIAWGVRKGAPQILQRLNRWLHGRYAQQASGIAAVGDLDVIRKRGVLRVLLRNNNASYFLYRGELMGFEYELAREFADSIGVRLEVVVPPGHEDLYSWLQQGRGDIAVGFLEPLEARRKQGFAYSRPYHFAPRHLVRHADSKLGSPVELAGKTVRVRRSSGYWDSMQALQQAGYSFDLQAADEDVETEELLAMVAQRDVDATVADGHLLDLEIARGTPIAAAFNLGERRSHAVAVMAQHPELLEQINAFIKKRYRGLVYNLLRKKYFTNPQSVKRLAAGHQDYVRQGKLSPWDEVVKQYAEQYGFDWRLLIAQMYQESRFNPKAKSFAGALGLMQVMPKTARSMGYKNLTDPDTGIAAGVKYLNWVRERFDASLPVNERIWFSLAAYNAGYGHVIDARRLAKQKGWNPDQWFDNTEKAMLLLSKNKYASKARHGYVRGREPVEYVRNIRDRFNAYSDLLYNRLPDVGSKNAQHMPSDGLRQSLASR